MTLFIQINYTFLGIQIIDRRTDGQTRCAVLLQLLVLNVVYLRSSTLERINKCLLQGVPKILFKNGSLLIFFIFFYQNQFFFLLCMSAIFKTTLCIYKYTSTSEVTCYLRQIVILFF